MNATSNRSQERRSPAGALCVLLIGAVAITGLAWSALAADPDEAPDASWCDPQESQCTERVELNDAAAEARRELSLGDAELSVDNLGGALGYWQRAVDAGRGSGAQASVTAQKRIQMYTLTTRPDEDGFDALESALGGDLLNTATFQHALKALGYFDGPVNGVHGVLTRSAIRKFQRDMAFDETDDLDARQIVYLIGNGAETARDPKTQTVLALMYAGGMGLPQRSDFTLAWLRAASTRVYGEATYYLAILHGTGHCDFPKREHLANQYLREASFQKHALAAELLRLYGKDWDRIAADARVRKSLDVIGDCKPAPAPRS